MHLNINNYGEIIMKQTRLKLLLLAASLTLLNACSQLTDSQLTANSNSALSNIQLNNPKLNIVGRTVKQADNSIQFGYPGVSVEFNTNADAAYFNAKSSGDEGRLDIFINGQQTNTIHLSKQTKTYTLFEQAQSAETHVKILNRSESWHGIATLSSIQLANGQLKAVNNLKSKNIILVGDSVSCGAALERLPSCKKEPQVTNPYHSYGMQIARALDANIHLICFSGRGLVRSWDNNTEQAQAPEFYDKTIAEGGTEQAWQHQNYQPDLVMVALGTNDFNPGIPNEQHYVDTYVKFVNKILNTHPSTQIALTEGSMLNNFNPKTPKKAVLRNYLQQVKSNVDNQRVHIIDSTYYQGDHCDSHPTLSQHTHMANDLLPQIKHIMHW